MNVVWLQPWRVVLSSHVLADVSLPCSRQGCGWRTFSRTGLQSFIQVMMTSIIGDALFHGVHTKARQTRHICGCSHLGCLDTLLNIKYSIDLAVLDSANIWVTVKRTSDVIVVAGRALELGCTFLFKYVVSLKSVGSDAVIRLCFPLDQFSLLSDSIQRDPRLTLLLNGGICSHGKPQLGVDGHA
ncbi:hypothetical protein Tco_0838941 [Tanacetum coccineum]|uniref:Secreted protein n=1 Tax=Tanacetum coccineum TaxID=301880 RepID=A0ABQ5AUA5_9ASTR